MTALAHEIGHIGLDPVPGLRVCREFGPSGGLEASDEASFCAAVTGRRKAGSGVAVPSVTRPVADARAASMAGDTGPAPTGTYRHHAARATAGMPPCVAKQVTRPIRNREARVMEPHLA
ncbi:hypothetical protein ABZ260_22620 [Streptosporangium sp. NPDC006013]|uniref:hypothetical protein n=1 Tax=Streptosporangium sp. NPDC006013 TaxID=3155596 RepID=UPI0033ABD60F